MRIAVWREAGQGEKYWPAGELLNYPHV